MTPFEFEREYDEKKQSIFTKIRFSLPSGYNLNDMSPKDFSIIRGLTKYFSEQINQ